MDDLSNPEMLAALRTMQVLQGLGMLVVPSVVYLWISSSWAQVKKLFAIPNRQAVMLSVVFFMVAFPFVNFIAEWNASWQVPSFLGEWLRAKENDAGELTELFLAMPTVGLLLFNLVMIAVIPALGEELIFRGIVQQGLSKRVNPHLAIWLAAILFSAVHVQFFGFVPRTLMGVAMGYLFFWSGNLWYPVIAHFTNNALAVGMAYGIQHKSIDAALENSGTGTPLLASFSLLFCLMLLYLFKQHMQAQQR